MKSRTTFLLWVPPVLLLGVGAFLYIVQSRLPVAEWEATTPAKLAKLAEGVESGRVVLSKDEVIALVKGAQRVEEGRMTYDAANEAAARTLAELLIALAVAQMAAIMFYLRDRKKRSADSE